MERHKKLFGDTAGSPKGPKPPLPTGCPPMTDDANSNSGSSSSNNNTSTNSSNKTEEK